MTNRLGAAPSSSFRHPIPIAHSRNFPVVFGRRRWRRFSLLLCGFIVVRVHCAKLMLASKQTTPCRFHNHPMAPRTSSSSAATFTTHRGRIQVYLSQILQWDMNPGEKKKEEISLLWKRSQSNSSQQLEIRNRFWDQFKNFLDLLTESVCLFSRVLSGCDGQRKRWKRRRTFFTLLYRRNIYPSFYPVSISKNWSLRLRFLTVVVCV